MATSWDKLFDENKNQEIGDTSWDSLFDEEEASVQDEDTFTSEDQGLFEQGTAAPYGVGQAGQGMSESMRQELGAAKGLEGFRGSAVETWSPPEIMASIFTGGSYAAWRIGGQTVLKALGTGGREAAVGTLTEVPISLVGETLRETYGWGAALVTELSGGLAAGMTADQFILNKMDDVGRLIWKSSNLKNLRRQSEETQEEVMDTLDNLLNVSSDRGNIVEPATPEVGENEVVDLNTLVNVPQLTIKEKPSFPGTGGRAVSEGMTREGRAQAQRRAKQLETFDQARRMERGEGPAGTPEDDMPEPARSMAQRAREAAAKKRQEIWDENQLKVELEKYEDEEAALSRLNELRRENNLDTYSSKDLENTRIGSKSKPADEATPETSRITEEEGISTETTILKKDGNPYKSEKSAQSAVKRKGLQDTYRVVEYGDGYALKGPSEQAGFAQKAEPGRPSEPAKKVDIEEREVLIRRIAQKRGATQVSREDEFKADFAQIADEYQPRDQADVPPRQGRTKQEEGQAQVQKDIEEFFEPYTDRDIDDEIPLSQFENGQVKDEYEMEVGFEDDIGYRDDDFISLQDLEAEEDSARTFDDFLGDLHTVFGKKIGLTIDDVSKTSTREQVEATMRLTKDLKRHRQKAVRMGLDLADYFKQMGFSDNIAQRLKAQTETLTQKETAEAVEETAEAAEKAGPGEVIDVSKVFGSFKKKLSTEWPFRKIGAHESGFAFKNYYSLKDMYEEEGRHAILRISRKFGLDEEDMADVALKRENPEHDLSHLSETKQARVNKAVDFVNEYFEKSLKDHQEAGVFEKPFPDVFIDRQQSKIARLQEQLKKESRPAKRIKLDSEIATAQERIEAVRGTRYTPVIREWLQDLANRDPSNFDKVIKLLNRKKRETPTIKSLLDAGLVSRRQIDIRDLISHYARRKAEDIANKKLLDALEADGLAKRIVTRNEKGKVTHRAKSEWPTPDKDRMPLFKDHAMHPRVKDYLEDFYKNIGRRNKFERFMSTVKMAQFYNPTIMPMYDTYQTTMLHGLDFWKIPKHVKDGVKSALKNDEEFREAAANGLFSKPFSNPMGSWQESIRKARLPMKKRALDLMNPMPHTAIKNYYNMAWDAAWKGDQIIRMASYKELKNRGFSPRAAAQLGALFHGDYASVPPGTRRVLNQTLFTPTFKMVMGKLYGSMAESAMKSGQELGKAKLPGMKTRALSGGLLGLLAVNHGKDMLMRNWGFERDTWGRRYTKEVDTDEGPREITVTFSDPANLPVQLINKTYEAIFPKPGAQSTPIGRFLEGNKYQFHPVLRTIFYDFMENRRIDGGRIYSEGDSDIMKYAKMAGYFTEQFIPVLKAFGLGDEDKKQRDILNEQFGRVQKNLLRIFAFPYVRKTEDRRLKYRINNLRNEMRRDIDEDMMDEERLERYREKFDKLRQEIQEE